MKLKPKNVEKTENPNEIKSIFFSKIQTFLHHSNSYNLLIASHRYKEVIDFLKSLRLKVIPSKPILNENHNSEDALEYYNNLKNYEFIDLMLKKISEEMYLECWNSVIDEKINDYIELTSGLKNHCSSTKNTIHHYLKRKFPNIETTSIEYLDEIVDILEIIDEVQS